MVANIPSDLFELLKSVLKDNIDQYDIETVKQENGGNFLGEIVITTLTHQISKEKKHLIVKQEREKDGKIVEELSVFFDREIYFYKEIWPYLQNVYKIVSGKRIDSVPKCLGTSNIGRKRIILENIKYQGYKLYDKTKPLDDDHCRYIFNTFGIFHGVSMALREQDSEQYDRFATQIPNFFKMIYKEGNPASADFVTRLREIEEFFDPIKEKPILEKISYYKKSGLKTIWQSFYDVVSNEVIAHGDGWSNNLMFKYDVSSFLQFPFNHQDQGHPDVWGGVVFKNTI